MLTQFCHRFTLRKRTDAIRLNNVFKHPPIVQVYFDAGDDRLIAIHGCNVIVTTSFIDISFPEHMRLSPVVDGEVVYMGNTEE